MNMKIVDLIMEQLGTITEHDIQRVTRGLNPPAEGEAPLGKLESESARRLCALSGRYTYQSILLIVQADGDSTSEEQVSERKAQAHWLERLGRVARDLFWAEVCLLLGEEGQRHGVIGLRKDWALVLGPCNSCCPDEAEGPGFDKGFVEMLLMAVKDAAQRQSSSAEPRKSEKVN